MGLLVGGPHVTSTEGSAFHRASHRQSRTGQNRKTDPTPTGPARPRQDTLPRMNTQGPQLPSLPSTVSLEPAPKYRGSVFTQPWGPRRKLCLP